jgi:hypothetical protein
MPNRIYLQKTLLKLSVSAGGYDTGNIARLPIKNQRFLLLNLLS